MRGRFAGSFGRSQSLGSAVALLLRYWTREVSGRHFRSSPSCSHLRSVPPRRPSAYRYLGVVLTPTLSWCNHVDHLVGRGRRLFAQCVSWVRSEGLPVSFSLFLLSTYVIPSASFGIEFAGECPRSLARFDRALRQWGSSLAWLAKWHTQCVGALRAWSSRWPARLLWSGFGSLCSSRFLRARLPSSCPSLSLHSRPIHPWQLGTLVSRSDFPSLRSTP